MSENIDSKFDFKKLGSLDSLWNNYFNKCRSEVSVQDILDMVLDKQLDASVKIDKIYEKIHAILCRPLQIEQVFEAVIKNALDALADISSKKLKVILSSTVIDKRPGVEICIADNGQGIPKNLWSKVFDKSYSTKGDQGYGLHFCSTIVHNHGGTIQVEKCSELKGALFKIVLPCHPTEVTPKISSEDTNYGLTQYKKFTVDRIHSDVLNIQNLKDQELTELDFGVITLNKDLNVTFLNDNKFLNSVLEIEKSVGKAWSTVAPSLNIGLFQRIFSFCTNLSLSEGYDIDFPYILSGKDVHIRIMKEKDDSAICLLVSQLM